MFKAEQGKIQAVLGRTGSTKLPAIPGNNGVSQPFPADWTFREEKYPRGLHGQHNKNAKSVEKVYYGKNSNAISWI